MATTDGLITGISSRNISKVNGDRTESIILNVKLQGEDALKYDEEIVLIRPKKVFFQDLLKSGFGERKASELLNWLVAFNGGTVKLTSLSKHEAGDSYLSTSIVVDENGDETIVEETKQYSKDGYKVESLTREMSMKSMLVEKMAEMQLANMQL